MNFHEIPVKTILFSVHTLQPRQPRHLGEAAAKLHVSRGFVRTGHDLTNGNPWASRGDPEFLEILI